MATLIETIGRFLNKQLAYGDTLISDGNRLYSYLVVIGEWKRDVLVIPDADKFVIRSTERHKKMLKAMATSQGIQVRNG